MDHYACIVVGAGQGGGPLAGAFARRGHRTLLVESSHLGGSCVNVGCTPTKTLVASARVAALARDGARYGVYTGGVTVDLAAVRERKREVVTSFREGSARGLAKAGVEVAHATARFAGPRTLHLDEVGGSGHRDVTADIVVLSTGLRPTRPPIPGLDDIDVLDSTALLELGELPARLAVIGAGFVGLEFAQMFRRFGSEVAVIDAAPRLAPHEDGDIAAALHSILADDGIALHLGHRIERVARHGASGVTVYTRDTSGNERIVAASHLLLAAGRQPNTDQLNLEAAGVRVDGRGFVQVDERLRTTATGVYAIGDVKGGPAFTHIAYDDFRVLQANLLDGESRTITHRMVPYTVFTDPQLGRIGLTEKAATDLGLRFDVYEMPMTHVARAIEMSETRGMMKVVVEQGTDRILGAAVLGVEGGELATLLQMAMMGGVTANTIQQMVFSHPTFAECLNNLFIRPRRSSPA